MLNRNVFILSLSQALATSGPPMIVLIGGLLGAELAPSPGLATLPISLTVVGLAAATIPAALLMRRIGRRKGFVLGAILAGLAALLAALAVSLNSFGLFCASVAIIGSTGAFVQQYRFAAAESVSSDLAGRAVSFILVGGIVAGFLGPQIANWSRDWLTNSPYSGSFLALAGLYLIVAALLGLFFRDIPMSSVETQGESRPLFDIITQPIYLMAVFSAAIGYGVMSFIMTATPLQMHTVSGFSLQDTTLVIQSHIIAMFVPSLFTGFLIERLGLMRIMLAGLASLATCVVLAIISVELLQYWGALVLLGIGWNFLFVGGTVLLSRSYRPAERFRAQAVNDFTVFGLQALASLSAGTVLYYFDWAILNWINVPILGLLLIFLVANRKTLRPLPEQLR